MPRQTKDMTGQEIGKLTVMKYHSIDGGGNALWECLCTCGRTAIVRGAKLRTRDQQSCGKPGCKLFTPRSRADLTGRVFGRLTVLGKAKVVVYGKQERQKWLCACTCGGSATPFTHSLVGGETRSCGCLGREKRILAHMTHGKWNSKEYILLHSAKRRAKKIGLPFNLELSDISIPDYCPLLGIKIECGDGSISPSSPTLDKIDPHLGYVKGNVWVISNKANQMKSDIMVEQMKHFIRVIEALPANAFAESGTNVNTVIVTMEA